MSQQNNNVYRSQTGATGSKFEDIAILYQYKWVMFGLLPIVVRTGHKYRRLDQEFWIYRFEFRWNDSVAMAEASEVCGQVYLIHIDIQIQNIGTGRRFTVIKQCIYISGNYNYQWR